MSGTRIAVVDEDPVFLELMALLLTTHGYTAIRCPHGANAFNVIRTTRPALVILDIRHGTDDVAWSVLDLLRLSPETSTIPVMVCSIDAEFLREKAPYFDMLGIVALEKPFRLTDLLMKVEREIGPAENDATAEHS